MVWLFESINSVLPVSNVALVILWAAFAGAISMLLYRRYSPQERLKTIQAELHVAQKAMNEYDGEFDGMWPLMKANLILSLKRVWISFGPSLVAAIPLILVMFCMDYQLAHQAQAVDQAANQVHIVEPIEQQPDPSRRTTMVSADMTDQSLATKRDSSGQDYLGFGPSWMRSWIFLFMVVSSASALTVRQIGGII